MSLLAVVTEQEHATELCLWAARLAASLDEELIIAKLNSEKSAKILEKNSQLLQTNVETELAQSIEGHLGLPLTSIRFDILESVESKTSVYEYVKKHNIKLLVFAKEDNKQVYDHSLTLEQAFEEAPCDTLALRLGNSAPLTCTKILIAVAGGSNALSALALTNRIVQKFPEIELHAAAICSSGLEEDEALFSRKLERHIRKAGLDPQEVNQHVVAARGVKEGLTQLQEEDHYDLIIVGASSVGLLRRFLFGTIPQKLLKKPEAPAIGVFRATPHAISRGLQNIEDLLDLTIPQMDREARASLTDRLWDMSQWNFDFLSLIILSTGIASLGLLQNSAAVVIGAMLVAPMMTPILGAGLSLVQGHLPLMSSAAKSISLGFITAVVISLLIGLIVGSGEITTEMYSRGGPNLLDIAIGFMSGLAAAYSSASPNLSAALPGVAIAAALVPPIATVGLSLSMGAWLTALGAAVLFGANVVSIILGSSLSFYCCGIRWQAFKKAQAIWFFWVSMSLFGVLFLLSINWRSTLPAEMNNRIKTELATLAPKCNLERALLSKEALMLKLICSEVSQPDLARQIKSALAAGTTSLAKVDQIHLKIALEQRFSDGGLE